MSKPDVYYSVMKQRHYFWFALLFVGLSVLPLHARAAGIFIPSPKTQRPDVPINESQIASAVLIDEKSGTVLYADQPGRVWTAASLTKLMTSNVFVSTPTKWEASVSITKADEVGGGRLQVPAGSVITLRDMLYSAIIGSANNCAEALGRLFDRSGMAEFVAQMNKEASALGLAQSRYYDASGMNEKNTLSAYDTAVLISKAAKDPEIGKAMSLATYKFTVKKPVINKTIKNTNDLLFSQSDLVITAGKTGYLEESQYNFAVRAYPKGHPEKELIAVVLGGKERKDSIDDSLALMRWAWSSYDWKESTSTVVLPSNRQLGDKGGDIRQLQKYLNAHGFSVASSGAGSPGKETTLFGELTKAALVRYQTAHADEILVPHAATKGSGYLDYYTRAAIHAGI
jgi:D-alanyl-D-alanine endopeptidase (penicillin-binding protein 7)